MKRIFMNLYPEIISELNRERIKDDMDAICLEKAASRDQSFLDKNLAVLGNLKISRGERLRNRGQSSQEVGSGKLVKKAA
jgi:hypothetical protein